MVNLQQTPTCQGAGTGLVSVFWYEVGSGCLADAQFIGVDCSP